MVEPLSPSVPLGDAACVCLGSGRFLRAVLVPAVEQAGLKSIIFQTRGDSFPKMMYGERRAAGTYEVDTVGFDGQITTTAHPVVAAGTLGSEAGRQAWLGLPAQLPGLRIVGVGVTEAGVAAGSQAMLDLAAFLYECYRADVRGPVSVINTDNVPGNGGKIEGFVTDAQVLKTLAGGGPSSAKEGEAFKAYLAERVVFHSTMVDRITSQREGSNGDVPRAEPLPKKALVIEDLNGVLPPALAGSPGVVVRREAGQIEVDHQLKLRIANAIHTAMVYFMALSRMPDTSACIGHPLILPYIEALYQQDIRRMAEDVPVDIAEVQAVYDDWTRRLQHPQFGLACLFVCQNASAKLGIRLGPTLRAALASTARQPLPGPAMAFAVAAMLRFLTPLGPQPRLHDGVFRGKMDDGVPVPANVKPGESAYAGDLKADFAAGVYDFRDGDGTVPRLLYGAKAAADAAGLIDAAPGPLASSRHAILRQAVGQALALQEGLRAEDHPAAGAFVALVAAFYIRMLDGTPAMAVLQTLLEGQGLVPPPVPPAPVTGKGEGEEAPLAVGEIERVVKEEVDKVEVIDLHTHLFPPSHGRLMLWGVDELLTYHYLIAEFFQTAPKSLPPDAFFALPKPEQADRIWQALFVDRSPLSEGCKGVLTTLERLGLREELRRRDLPAIRAWFAKQDPEAYCERVFQLAGVRYCVMTNIPFDPEEASHWRPHKKPYSARFRSALRVDPLLKGDWHAVAEALKAADYPLTMEGAKQYLRDWAATMQPEYLMASTPHDFHYGGKEEGGEKGIGREEEEEHGHACGVTMIDRSPKGAELLDQVLIPVAEELNLPIAMKLGAHRGVNPSLRTGGDGVVAADVGDLRRLCAAYPRVKFLATFLARVSQHEAAVLANKFPNLHLYGCWWYCNNPSIIREITAMRLEILGTGFTAQHSDARVLDQLVYKWSHSRRVIGEVLAGEYALVAQTGWKVTRAEVRRDVWRLLGGAYEEFMKK